MRRRFGVDVLDGPRCHARMALSAATSGPAVAHRILSHLGLPTRAPPRGPPWRAQRDLTPERRAHQYDGVDPPAFID